jgi:purine-binding chemotaxis protein CheW
VLKDNSFLTFNLHGRLFAIDAAHVTGIIWLPELTIVEERPRCIAGVINMYGDIVPVMDLLVRFGHNPEKYSCADKVIVLGLAGLESIAGKEYHPSGTAGPIIDLMGIIVTDVLDVLVIPEKNIEPVMPKTGAQNPRSLFVSSEAKSGEEIFMVIDLYKLFDTETSAEELSFEENKNIPENIEIYFSPGADCKEKEIFHNRAINLQKLPSEDDAENLKSVAVFSLNNEFLCVELEAIREFSRVHNLTHVPCCPGHIIGNMNLRGTVVTIIDICGLLNLTACSIVESTKVIVADAGEFPVGIVVDEIIDVIYLKTGNIVPVPVSIKIQNGKFLKGAVSYGSRIIVLLDFKEILLWNGLVVDEEVQ